MDCGVGEREGGPVVVSAEGVDGVRPSCFPVPVSVSFDQSNDVYVEFVDPGA